VQTKGETDEKNKFSGGVFRSGKGGDIKMPLKKRREAKKKSAFLLQKM